MDNNETCLEEDGSLGGKLKLVKNKGPDEINVIELSKIEREFNSLLEWNETMWRQWLRHIWLKTWDSNSRFFYSKENGRRIRNCVSSLFDLIRSRVPKIKYSRFLLTIIPCFSLSSPHLIWNLCWNFCHQGCLKIWMTHYWFRLQSKV